MVALDDPVVDQNLQTLFEDEPATKVMPVNYAQPATVKPKPHISHSPDLKDLIANWIARGRVPHYRILNRFQQLLVLGSAIRAKGRIQYLDDAST